MIHVRQAAMLWQHWSLWWLCTNACVYVSQAGVIEGRRSDGTSVMDILAPTNILTANSGIPKFVQERIDDRQRKVWDIVVYSTVQTCKLHLLPPSPTRWTMLSRWHWTICGVECLRVLLRESTKVLESLGAFCLFVYVHYVCVWVYVCVYMCVSVCICMCLCVCVCVCMYMCVSVCICVCLCVYVSVCLYDVRLATKYIRIFSLMYWTFHFPFIEIQVWFAVHYGGLLSWGDNLGYFCA